MLITILSFFIGLAGACLMSAGAWLVSPAAGLIVGGIICLVWSFCIALIASDGIQKSGGE
ncbi:hypothetical protein FGH87_24495 [Salmonella enterica]|uniref:Uncharacterized protein n=4 Tax=Salmonella TaxID=590 RepID=A0A749S4R1_SALER|nr:hypothetical protein [Salmonella bongori]EAA7091401.1 hypothetical protein [Salmonella enterica subsp. enterica serovar Koketime]EAB8210323.1 hypothetical protein [Salmonella enterica subsp. enterica serovar Lattenkamp]EAM8932919.1 hypothetical protein [Salmonella enterica]ECJ3924957.1 hypothetical protein [Salmonella enterica subsp. enterica]EGE4660473.1 hypothetical protein [Salmonella bongori serovar 48:i:- str. 94-0708]